MVKVLIVILVPFLFACEGLELTKNDRAVRYEFSGIYFGLTEDYEFEFADESGNTYLLQDLENYVFYDLYEEIYWGNKFQVIWEERVIKDELKSSGIENSVRKNKVIVGLKML